MAGEWRVVLPFRVASSSSSPTRRASRARERIRVCGVAWARYGILTATSHGTRTWVLTS
jgi:hypothetical protein